MPAQLLFFGRFRDFGAGLEEAPQEIETLGQLRAWIGKVAPEIGDALQHSKARIAVDGEIAQNENVSLRNAREIAFLPPMSGG
jgi:molybdopterin converting factor small subunit